ncbi:YbhB/YbcL family Raf kinase inhibitor-like protein [Halorussus sp. MSC15.2]|uniref:YbhB/YbcL family Raf kinase inhibitor-like protein n=1 Tax=Halorussus sp. MSC15.2 TaxID=2283638 RepID=UPI0013D33101|nr:YbhB/YbcL family Raf kinase inhibitor-like protein [Halorussus sp. MSC15.2]NEU57835.1 YbhB/YbcL family Raf kinase inhibitor-like protein [Halorussus sp. MSC15.2]
MADLSFRTSAFTHGESIPEKYTCEGEDVSPELTVGGAPDDAAALAVVVDDPDAPAGTFTHWLLWNLPPDTVEIEEGVEPREELPDLGGARQGENDFGDVGYRGPCPPEGDGPHEYRFTLYALDEELDAEGGALRPEVQDELDAKTIDSDQFTGTFSRE